MIRLTLGLAAVGASTFALGTASAAISPTKLYAALLTKSYPDSQLPNGFLSAKVGISSPSKAAKKLHVVGEVEVDVDGPDPDDGLLYVIFPKVSEAKADLARKPTGGHMHLIPGGVPGIKLPSQLWAGSITGKNAFGKTVTDGATAVDVRKGNVVLGAITDSSDNKNSGNIPGAIALVKSGLHHLSAVEKKISRKH